MNVSKLAGKTGWFCKGLSLTVLVSMLPACASRTYYENPPAMPLPMEPVNASVLSNGTPVRFVWRASNTTEHYDFHVFDRTTGDIQRYYRVGLKPASVCSAEVCSLTLTLAMPVDDGHAWRVRAYNSAGNSAWSRTLFKIEQ